MARPAAQASGLTPARRAALETGTAETANLAEALRIDLPALLRATLPGVDPSALEAARTLGYAARMRLAAGLVLGAGCVETAAAHPSDSLRGMAALAVGLVPGLSLAQRLEAARPFARDGHFAVREWAWMGVRDAVAAELDGAIAQLTAWTAEADPRLRRFAVEATRPRGVWCAHLRPLRSEPWRGRPLLDPLRSEADRSPQDSVANWLNDAAKDHPDWVASLLAGWRAGGDGPATARIARRALRSRPQPGA